ncbi:MAG: DNA gyrase subunit A [Myxococcales bacterium]|nr:DNA gyrase subunit A [Myxococcales bacterium]
MAETEILTEEPVASSDHNVGGLSPDESGNGGDGGNGGDDGGDGHFEAHPYTISIEQEMRSSYVDYAMSVIVGRALPDVRDGLKPVHRRVLFTQHEMRNNHNAAYKKSARIVGDCIGKYHPHGDTAVYDTLVRMAQTFSLRAPLVDGQGNFGSIDGDPAAAMRYTEVRMTKLAHELLADLDKETVDFQDNYDGHDREPTVLPTRVPNLLVNGSSGIAVGMATNIPPHNMREVIDATIAFIDNPAIEVGGLMEHISGPDFPTGGIIYGRQGIYDAYTTGRGKLKVRALTHIEQMDKSGRERIVVDELPYQVNKARLLEYIANLVRDKKIEGISDLRDESDRHGIRMVIEVKRDAIAELVLNHLYRLTNLQTTFGIINLSIVAGQPQVLTLQEMIRHFVDHRREVVTRRCLYELRQAEARAHILEGLLIALDHLDQVIELIRASPDGPTARERLVERFSLTEGQAQAILDMRLQRLTGLERDKIKIEHDELMETITWLKRVLAEDGLLMGIITDELIAVRDEYADDRRTKIVDDLGVLSMEDLIADDEMVITLSTTGYIKRTPLTEYRAQRRGGRGKTGMTTKQDDVVSDLFVATAHQPILFFTSKGRAFSLKAYELPKGTRTTRGKPVINLLPVDKDEDIKAVLPVKTFDDPDAHLLLATRNGKVKKTTLAAYSKIRSTGIIGIVLEEGDDLIDARLVYPNSTVLLATRNGIAIHFRSGYNREANLGLRPMGRVSRGVKGITLKDGDEVVSMAVLHTDERAEAIRELGENSDNAEADEAALAAEENDTVADDEANEGADEGSASDYSFVMMTISENGYGKLTSPSQYRIQRRGGLGKIDLKTTKGGKPTKTGKVVGLRVVRPDSQVLLLTDNGKLIRTHVGQIRVVRRNTMGVKVIVLAKNEKVVSFDNIYLEEEEVSEQTEAAVAAETTTETSAVADSATEANQVSPDAVSDAANDED